MVANEIKKLFSHLQLKAVLRTFYVLKRKRFTHNEFTTLVCCLLEKRAVYCLVVLYFDACTFIMKDSCKCVRHVFHGRIEHYHSTV